VVIEAVVGLSHRAASCGKVFVLSVQVVGINIVDSGGNGQGWERVIILKLHVLAVGFTSKVTMVMMTLSAFLHRKDHRFCTREFSAFSG